MKNDRSVMCSPTLETLMSLSEWEGSGRATLKMRRERCLSYIS